MEPPVIVEFTSLRAMTVGILAYWADRDLQQREWIQRVRFEPFWNTFWDHLGEVEDRFDPPTPPEESIGFILASPDEALRLQPIFDCIDELGHADGVSFDKPETFFDNTHWHQVNRLSQAALNLSVMNGGCWDNEVADDNRRLVADYRLRALVAQCLASLADHGSHDLTENPPLQRDFDEATTTLVDRCALSDPQSAIERIYRDGDEIPRLQRLDKAIQRDVPKSDIAALAGHALTAVVRAGFGWNYDGPIDATTR